VTSSIATDTYGGRLGATPAMGAIGAFSSNQFAQLDIAATVTTAVTTPSPSPVTTPSPSPVTTPPPTGDQGGQRGSGDHPSSSCSSNAPFGAKSTGKSDWDYGDTDGKFSRHGNHKHNCDD
jgi:predicted component of type VI protein secretion system